MISFTVSDTETDCELSPVSDYFVTTDNNIPEKKILATFEEWELIFYKNYYPNYTCITYNMFLDYVDWHYQFLRYRYSK